MSHDGLLLSRDGYAQLAESAYKNLRRGEVVIADGKSYKVIDSVSTKSGFQGVLYQYDDQFAFSFRGTEIKLGDPVETSRDLGTDVSMVTRQINEQAKDAEAFTQRALERIHREHPDWVLSEHVHVTGHSLGGTHAETQAAKHGLGGAAFNSYGAVDLRGGVPEGQPANAPVFTNYVRATDVVSAASRHYGSVRVFATEQDLRSLQHGRYLDAPDPRHPANPLLVAGDISAHFISNFAPDPGKGESIMTTANEARYEGDKAAIDHYRGDVLTTRGDLHAWINRAPDPRHAERVKAAVGDAASVAGYGIATRRVERALGVPTIENGLAWDAETIRGAAEVTHVGTEGLAHGVRQAGRAVHDGASEVARGAHAVGGFVQQGADALSQSANAVAGFAPASAAIMRLDAQAESYIARVGSERVVWGAHAAGEMSRAAAEKAAQGIHAAGEHVHGALDGAATGFEHARQLVRDAADRAASRSAHDAAVDAAARAGQAASRGIEAAREAVDQAYEALSNPGRWFHRDAPQKPSQADPAAALQRHRARTVEPTVDSDGLRGDPRKPGNPSHELFNELRRLVPEACENRLLQFTAACYERRIDERNLARVHLDERNGAIAFASGGLTPELAVVDLRQASPSAAQSIRDMQVTDQRQADSRASFQAWQTQQGQQEPAPGCRGL